MAITNHERVVLVGNKMSPGNPSTKPDGTVVRTLWGELAWQLGGKKALSRIKADDEKATSPRRAASQQPLDLRRGWLIGKHGTLLA